MNLETDSELSRTTDNPESFPPKQYHLVVILGPTAVGKTEIAIELAERLEGEIVSADSRLLYRGMDIGTDKPTFVQRKRIPHYLIDVADPDQVWSLTLYQEAANKAINDIQAGKFIRKKQPISSPTRYAKRMDYSSTWNMIDWEKWAIDHCWHFLRCNKFWIHQLRKQGYMKPFHDYNIGNYEIAGIKGEPGSIALDERGLYFVHAEGKIRILDKSKLLKYSQKIILGNN